MYDSERSFRHVVGFLLSFDARTTQVSHEPTCKTSSALMVKMPNFNFTYTFTWLYFSDIDEYSKLYPWNPSNDVGIAGGRGNEKLNLCSPALRVVSSAKMQIRKYRHDIDSVRVAPDSSSVMACSKYCSSFLL